MRRSDRSRSRSRSPARKRGRSPSPPPPASTQRQWATDRIDESDEVRARRVAQQLERLKKGREERQKAALERQQSQGGGGGDGEFAYQEAAFHVSQAKLRAEKRVQDGRGKLLDLLVILAHPSIPLPPGTVVPRPSRLFRRLPAADKSELQAELPILHSADEEGREVWEAAAMLLRGDPGAEGMHSTILPDVDALLSSLEGQGLEELQAMVESEARRGDEEYWGALLRRLKRRQAEAVLERRHALWFQSRPEEEREAIQSALDAPEVEEEEVAAEAEEEEDVMEEEETHRPRRPNVRSLTAEELWKREKERGMTQDEEQFQQVLSSSLFLSSLLLLVLPFFSLPLTLILHHVQFSPCLGVRGHSGDPGAPAGQVAEETALVQSRSLRRGVASLQSLPLRR